MLLTSGEYGDLQEADDDRILSTLNDDVAELLPGRLTLDSGVFTGSQWSLVMSAQRVGGIEDWSWYQRVVISQADHEVVQTTFWTQILTAESSFIHERP